LETVADLVLGARAGNRRAFAVLVHRYLRAAHAVALAELGDPTDAEDVCQDAFLIALERLEECRRPERFGGWLMQIVRNRARNLRRGQGVRSALTLEAVQAVAVDDVALSLERAELGDRLEAALKRLARVQREIVLLHDVEGFRHREIAELLGLSEGASRVQLHRARTVLRSALEPLRIGAGKR
jgi:RNA polymerase sigma-70 factor (ECF subfamily)